MTSSTHKSKTILTRILFASLATFWLVACERPGATAGEEQAANEFPHYDLIIQNGTVYDGSGGEPRKADIAIQGDRIAAIGPVMGTAEAFIEADGLAVAPGFINMLSWSSDSLIEDGHSQSEIRQGVTLQVMGEGWSMGPWNESMKQRELSSQGDIKFDIEWDTLGGYLQFLENRGISPNVASFVGATTVRVHEIGYEDRAPTPDELESMKALVRQAMEEGALGVGSSLIYAPAFYASTEELIELNKVAAEYGGRYISHMRSEGNQLLEAVEELITIAWEAGIGAEIYHLKASGQKNWHKLESRRRAPRGWTSRRTCTPIPPVQRGFTPPCRHGCRKAATPPGWSG